MQAVVYYPANSNSKMVAGARLARWLASNLRDVPEFSDSPVMLLDANSISGQVPTDDGAEWGVPPDYVLFIINVPKTMVADVPRTERLVEAAQTVVWIQNDYTIWSPTPDITAASIVNRSYTRRYKSGKPVLGWTTCLKRVEQHGGTYSYVNWNAIAYAPLPERPELHRVVNRVLYFGAFREGREKDFDKYMMLGTDLFDVSAPLRAKAIFQGRYGFKDNQLHDVLKIPDELQAWSSTLYLEDDMSHRQYHSPANRFYEALSANMAIIVDQAAVGTLRKAGFEVPIFALAQNHTTLKRAMEYREKIHEHQRTWHTDKFSGLPHNEMVKARLLELCKRHFG
jgi:hypothetical protein